MKKIATRYVLFLALVAVMLPGSVFSADYPSKALTYIICFNPGGESDITARIQEPALKKYFGQDVVVTYKIGGGGSVGWSELIRSKPDGYTIAGDNLPHIILQPLERGNAGYNTLDLKQIYMFESTPDLLVVREDSPYQNPQGLHRLCQEKSARDCHRRRQRQFNRQRSGDHDAQQGRRHQADLHPVRRQRFRCAGPSGRPCNGADDLFHHGGQYKGKFRSLAIASEERMAVLPDVPTFKELGYDVVEGAYRGVAAPPGTPDEIVNKLADTFDKVMKDPDVQKKMDRERIQNRVHGARGVHETGEEEDGGIRSHHEGTRPVEKVVSLSQQRSGGHGGAKSPARPPSEARPTHVWTHSAGI